MNCIQHIISIEFRVLFTRLLLSVFVLSNLVELSAQESEDNFVPKEFNTKRFEMLRKPPEIAEDYFKKASDFYISSGDSANHLICVSSLSVIEMHKGHFNRSFELLWEILPMANELNDKTPLIQIHQVLGILYGIYGKDSIALSHTIAGHNLSRILEKEKGNDYPTPSSFLDVAVRLVEMQRYPEALMYLDSCYTVNTNGKRLYYVDVSYAEVHLKLGNIVKSKEYAKGVLPYFEQVGTEYSPAVFKLFGDLKKVSNEMDSAIFYYKRALSAINAHKSYFKLKPEIHTLLSELYFELNESSDAFQHLKVSKFLSDSLFNTQSKQNKALFEIKNKYKEDLDRKKAELESKSKLLNLEEKASFRLRILVIILIAFAVIGLYTIQQRFKVKRLVFQQATDKEKNAEILEFKNKELTANALQFIEKEQAVEELLELILIKSPEKHKELKRKFKQSNKKIWDDFHLRFTQTNNQFYEHLLKRHPELTQTDLKHCALIKLSFDSKEMSHLLGISVNSVHMARSRIRKKVGLKRNESLGSYLANL